MSTPALVTNEAIKDRERPPVVVGGLLQYVSGTVIQGAEDCFRMFWFEHVARVPRVFRAALGAGKQLHLEQETYLKTGDRNVLSPLARAGLEFLPKASMPAPGAKFAPEYARREYVVEHDFESSIASVKLTGQMDLVRFHEAPRILEIDDHKTTSKKQYAKTPEMLAVNTQAIIYSGVGFRGAFGFYPELVRFKHIYYLKGTLQGKSWPVEKLLTRGHVEAEWAKREIVVRTMQHLARERDVEKVPYNQRSCANYGGCSYANRCSKSPQFEFARGVLGSGEIQKAFDNSVKPTLTESLPGVKKMGLLDKVKAENKTMGAGEPPKPPPPAAQCPRCKRIRRGADAANPCGCDVPDAEVAAPVAPTTVAPSILPVNEPPHVEPAAPLVSPTLTPPVVAEVAPSATIAPPPEETPKRGPGRPKGSGKAKSAVESAAAMATDAGEGVTVSVSGSPEAVAEFLLAIGRGA